MRKPELLAPAGDLEKLKIAIIYGADAVYIGGKELSLRARSSNFEIPDIKEACEFANAHGAKVYVTTNILPHNEDLVEVEQYFTDLYEAGVSAVIVASPTLIASAQKAGLETHLSTQTSTTNSSAIDFWKSLGVTRTVTARELSIEEIAEIKAHASTEVEVFIHGGMCVAYSGRCTLSNHMTDRDSNRGGCAHSCRWNYTFYDKEGAALEEDDHYVPFSMSSKDLNAIEFITRLIDIGIESLKIEGRMKSVHYIATVVGTYRKLIDDYTSGKEIDIKWYMDELDKAENREASIGFFDGNPQVDQHLYNMRSEQPLQNFIGYVLDYEDGYAIIEERNKFESGIQAEIIGPDIHEEFVIEEILDADGNEVSVAFRPKEILKIKVPFVCKKHDIIRKVL